jgi:hypothetical protein
MSGRGNASQQQQDDDAGGNVDFYATLNVPRGCSPHDVKQAYTRLALSFHPDKQRNAEDSALAAEQFFQVKRAYKVLSDDAMRLAYDKYGHEGLRVVAEGGEKEVVKRRSNKELERTIEMLVMKDRYAQMDKAVGARGAISVHSTVVPLLSGSGGGPRMTKMSISQYIRAPLDNMTSVTYGGYVMSNYGLSIGGVSLGGERRLTNNTLVHCELDAATDGSNKVSVSTTRVLDKGGRTGAKVGFGLDPASSQLGCNLDTWRTLRNGVVCRCNLGMVNGNFTTLMLSGSGRTGGAWASGDVGLEPRELYARASVVKEWGDRDLKQTGKARIKLGTRGTQVVVQARRNVGKVSDE